jgi:hypothetical protein
MTTILCDAVIKLKIVATFGNQIHYVICGNGIRENYRSIEGFNSSLELLISSQVIDIYKSSKA